MGFKFDTNNTFGEGGQMPAGNYEVLINKCELDHTKGGKEYVRIDLVVRDDVIQKYQNAFIFEKAWKGTQTGEYNMKQFNTMAKACNLGDGQEFATFEDMLAVFVGKPVKVRTEYEEYNGNQNLRVRSWMRTDYPQVNHMGKMKTQEVNLDDCPF